MANLGSKRICQVYRQRKIQALIDKQRINLADVEYLNLEDVANIVNNFENPEVPEIKNDSRWSEEEWSKARKFAKEEIRKSYVQVVL